MGFLQRHTSLQASREALPTYIHQDKFHRPADTKECFRSFHWLTYRHKGQATNTNRMADERKDVLSTRLLGPTMVESNSSTQVFIASFNEVIFSLAQEEPTKISKKYLQIGPRLLLITGNPQQESFCFNEICLWTGLRSSLRTLSQKTDTHEKEALLGGSGGSGGGGGSSNSSSSGKRERY
ncbi:hypothetical protein GQR58_020772 [Nymphon striatum]|nr:hypothetical protein GQR58_020772 [Nymphon striatum]